MDHGITALHEPDLQIQLFGDFRLTYQGKVLTSIASPRLQSLLAYLLCHREAAQSRQHVAFTFWPDLPEKAARNNLRQALYQLRQALPDEACFLDIDGNSASWRVDSPFLLDVAEFERGLTAANTPETRQHPEALRPALERVVSLYRGNLLPSCYDDWVLPERTRLHQQYLAALEQIILLCEGQRDYPAAIRFAQQYIHSDPLYEPGYRLLMRLYTLNDDRANALRAYQTCEEVLERELGVKPEAATQAAYNRLLAAASPAPASRIVSQLAPPLVGRKEVWAQILAEWSRAAAGDPHLLLLSGEAGIGKTRLSEELLDWSTRLGISSAATRAYAAEGQLAFDPIVEWLRSAACQIGIAALEKTWQAELSRLLPELSGVTSGPQSPELTLETWQRQKFFQALQQGIRSASQPLLLVIDDLQWCDPDTLEWLHFFLRAVRGERILLVGTLRIEEVVLNRPLQALLADLRRSQLLTEIGLAPLNSAETALLAREATNRPWDAAASAALFHETEGNPLFILATLRSGLLSEETAEGRGLPDSTPILPTRVQSVISTRLASLSPIARELAGIAAAVGRSFTPQVLALASGISAEDLARSLGELWQRRILREEGQAVYDFSHNKLRDVAYAEISPPARPMIHRQIAQALETIHAANLDPVSAQLAAHYEQAGITEKAVEFLTRAARVALRVGANGEGMRFMTRALTILETQIEVPDHDPPALDVRIGRGESLTIGQGASARDTVIAYTRAQILEQRLGRTRSRPVLRAFATAYISLGKYSKALGVGAQLLNQADGQASSFLEADAHYVVGISLFWMGELARSQDQLAEVIRLYQPEEARIYLLPYTQDAKLSSLSRLAFSLACQGFLGRAFEVSRQAIAYGVELGHLHSLGYALYWDALLHNHLGLYALAAEKAKGLVAHAQEYHLSQWLPYGAVMQGWATAELGDVQRGISLMREGMQVIDSFGIQFFGAFFQSLLAEQVRKAGDLGKSLALLEESLASLDRTGERWCEAELHRRLGEQRRQQAEIPGAEAEFRRALQVAQSQGARLFELRAAVQLARLLSAQERGREACALLLPIATQFSEEDDLPDLISARKILESTWG